MEELSDFTNTVETLETINNLNLCQRSSLHSESPALLSKYGNKTSQGQPRRI